MIPRMNSGGSERVVANLSNYFCKNNDVRIVTLAEGQSYYPLNKKVEYRNQPVRINRKNILTTLACYSGYFLKTKIYIERNIDEFKPDCIISFLVEADFLVYLATKKRHNIVKIFSERADPTRRNKIRQLMGERAYKSSDLFVCQSKKMFDYYVGIPSEKKVVIPNPLDISVLPEAVPREKKHDIVAIGRLSEQKNFELLIGSFVSSINELPNDCNLIIYGDGPQKQYLQKIIDDYGMNERIKLAGAKKDVLNNIKTSALFVLPSNFEGFPNVLLEAMALGLPVISTDFYTGIARELIKKENGAVVHVGDENGLSMSIVDIMGDGKKRQSMRKNNVSVREKYSVENIGEIWLKYISKLVEAKNGR